MPAQFHFLVEIASRLLVSRCLRFLFSARWRRRHFAVDRVGSRGRFLWRGRVSLLRFFLVLCGRTRDRRLWRLNFFGQLRPQLPIRSKQPPVSYCESRLVSLISHKSFPIRKSKIKPRSCGMPRGWILILSQHVVSRRELNHLSPYSADQYFSSGRD